VNILFDHPLATKLVEIVNELFLVHKDDQPTRALIEHPLPIHTTVGDFFQILLRLIAVSFERLFE
jgi:hypothetical protein